MYYQIYYENDCGRQSSRKVMFDIEIFLKQVLDPDVKTNRLWYVEMHADSFVSGAVQFIRDKMTFTGNDWEQFGKDCRELEELRGWLWETHRNTPRLMEDADKDLQEWREYVKNKVYGFAEKYKLNVNVD